MKRILISLAMLSVCLSLPSAAQEETTAQPDTKPCLKLKKIQTDTDAVAQGGKIRITLRLEASGCELVYQQRDTPFTVEGLAFEAESPFRVERGSTWYHGSDRDLKDKAAGTTRKLEYELIVEALPDAPVGKQDLVATASYQAADSESNVSLRQQPLTIPINIVPAGAHVKLRHELSSKEKRDTAILIALAPVLVPLMLIGGVVYFFQHGQWPTC